MSPFFFPLPIAIALTAVVHFLHNVLKSAWLWRDIDRNIAIPFGFSAILAVFPGAWLLQKLSSLPALYTYSIWKVHAEISILHILVGVIFIFFATSEALKAKLIPVNNMMLAGALSGFLGGLSGNQGAVRSVFLVNSDLTKEGFIATTSVIGMAVDFLRLILYTVSFGALIRELDLDLLYVAIFGATMGIIFGMFFLSKLTMELIQKSVVFFLYFFGILFLLGII